MSPEVSRRSQWVDRLGVMGLWATVFLVFGFQWLYLLCRPVNFFDEGYWLESIHFVAHGLRPYVDFRSDYGPLNLRILSALVTMLGGELVDLRFVMGIAQGFVCFCLLAGAMGVFVGRFAVLSVALLVAVTAAHPALDPTMYWGLRYYSVLPLLALLAGDLAGIRLLSNRARLALFALQGPLFFYSGEAGVYLAAALLVYALILVLRSRSVRAIQFAVVAWLFGFGAMLLLLRQEAFLYLRRLLIEAPQAYGGMSFGYPALSVGNFHYYLPFVMLGIGSAVLVMSVRDASRRAGPVLIASVVLLLSLKVSTTRSDEAHLSYCYPFVLFLFAVLVEWARSRLAGSNRQRGAFIGGLCVLLAAGLFRFEPVQAASGMFDRVSSFVFHPRRFVEVKAWGIYLPEEEASVIAEAVEKFRQIPRSQNSKLVIFPYQQTLYSLFGVLPQKPEAMNHCTIQKNRQDCIASFNGTDPDEVIWIPEGTYYSWAVDGYFSAFEYSQAFRVLHTEFDAPISLGRSGWKLFRRRRGAARPAEWKEAPLDLREWVDCPQPRPKCEYVAGMAEGLRLDSPERLRCSIPSAQEAEKMAIADGVSIKRDQVALPGGKPLWFCRSFGSPDCTCSRVRDFLENNSIFTAWSWDGFLSGNADVFRATAMFSKPESL